MPLPKKKRDVAVKVEDSEVKLLFRDFTENGHLAMKLLKFNSKGLVEKFEIIREVAFCFWNVLGC